MVRRTPAETTTREPTTRRVLSVSPDLAIPLSEIRFRFSRSGGAGGQHVNKVSTRVELLFSVRDSTSLTDGQRKALVAGLANRLDGEGSLLLVSDESRSQWKNREIAFERFRELLRRALVPRKKRIATHAHASARERRIQGKKRRGATKAGRRRPDSA